jgi:SAM-dependent methyltransferase
VSVQWEAAASCGFCGESGWTPERRICGRRYGRCHRCGIVRLVDRLREQDLPAIYDSYYAPAAEDGPPPPEALANPTFGLRLARLEAARDSRPRRFFEVGCGDGHFLLSLRAAGWQVSGSEHGPTAAAVARRHGLDIRSVEAAFSEPPDRPYPMVGAYHVLEHLYDPAGWLRRVKALLEPSGILHIQVPNYGSLTRRLTGEGWASWRFPEHVYFFTPETLTAVLLASGYTVRRLTTWDPWHGPGTASASLATAARMWTGGASPWTDDIALAWPGTPAPVPTRGRAPWKVCGRLAVEGTGSVLARVERLFGTGGVVDVIAERN